MDRFWNSCLHKTPVARTQEANAAETAGPYQIAGLMTSEINDFSTLHEILPGRTRRTYRRYLSSDLIFITAIKTNNAG